MSTPTEKRIWRIRQQVHLSWVHDKGCPERDELAPRPERCRCGMPPILALECARETALHALRKGLENGDWSPPGPGDDG